MFGASYFGTTYFGVTYFGEGGATDYDVIQSLQVWWSSQATLQALFSDGKLWHLQAPENTLLPYLTYFLVSEPVEVWTTAFGFWRSTVQFNTHHWTTASARLIAHQLALAMSTINPTNTAGAVLPIHGQDALHVLPGDVQILKGEGLGPKGKDCWIVSFTLDIPWTQ